MKAGKQPASYPCDGTVRIRRDVAGRKGKTVTAIFGVPLENEELQEFAKTLKRRCGAGGSAKDGVILIQGDHPQALLEELAKSGYSNINSPLSYFSNRHSVFTLKPAFDRAMPEIS